MTPDLLGPVKNGGIGTACAYLAKALVEAHHEVQLLFTQNRENTANDSWKEDYLEQGIQVDVPFQSGQTENNSIFPNHAPLAIAKAVYEWLISQPDFDLVLFMDWQGNGFYALHAKQCGLHFQKTAIFVYMHSPSFWHAVHNATFPGTPREAITWHMERKSIEMADALISPSAYMLLWCEQHGYKLPPSRVFVQPNILDVQEKTASSYGYPVNEIVFFGRLEYRKGLEQFCNAMDILHRDGAPDFKITFLGKASWMGDEHSVLYISRRAKRWNIEPVLKLTADHEEALKYLSEPGRIAVMPSISENSPYTVYECLAYNIPFLARDSGGTAELINAEDQGTVLFGDSPGELAEKLRALLKTPPQKIRLAFDLKANRMAWQRGLVELSQQIINTNERPFISVCLVHYNRPHLLKKAIESFMAQDYKDFELLLGDDGSPGEETKQFLASLEPLFAEKGWKIFRMENGYVGKARNYLAKQARGDWLLFFDDDNIAMSDMLEKCAKAASNSQNGFIALMFNVFEGDAAPTVENQKENFCPLGDILSYSALNNTIADATCLIHKKAFERCGGFTEDYGLGHEDYELYLRAILAGEKFGIIPEPIFWYRRIQKSTSMLQSTNEYANRMRSLRPFVETDNPQRAELALIACSMNLHAKQSPGTRSESAHSFHSEERDPQSDEILAELADLLAADKMPGLSRQLRETINENSVSLSREAKALMSEALKAASAGRHKELHRFLQSFQTIKAKDMEKAFFYLGVLDSIPKSDMATRNELLQKIERIPEPGINAYFDLAERYHQMNRDDKCLANLMKAFQVADRIYLEKRPDVDAAIKEGQFFAPFQHYAIFGYKENMRWPYKSRFIKILKCMSAQIPKLLEYLATEYRFPKNIALKAIYNFIK